RDLGNDIAPTLNFDPVADLHTQAVDLVHVVKRGAANGRPADGNWFQRCHGSQLSGPANLHKNVFDLSNSGSRGILVRDGPARSFAGETESALERGTVDLDYDAVNFVRQRFALLLPLANEIPDFVKVRGEAATGVHFETGRFKSVQRVPVSIEHCPAVCDQ